MKGDIFKKNSQAGQQLLEILIAITVAGIIFSGVTALVIVSRRASRTTREVALAQTLIQDMSAAVRGLASQDWHSMWGSSNFNAYFAMNESANEKLSEPVSGNNATINLGTLGNTSLASAWQAASACKAGSCLSFDGSDDYVTLDSQPTLAGGFTLTAWVYPNNVGGPKPIFDNNQMQLRIASAGGSYHCVLRRIGGSMVGAQSTTAPATSTWAFLACTWDGSTLSVYVNGGAAQATNSATSTTATTTEARIGSASDGSSLWNGIIDEVRIYNRALSQSEVQALYDTVNHLYPQSSGGLWQIKEGNDIVNSGGNTFARSFTIDSVQRDASNNIVASGGTDDPSTKKITYRVSWGERTLTSSEYITRSATKVILQTDWVGGPGDEGPAFQGITNKYSTSSGVYTTTTGEFRLKLNTE